MQTRTQLTNERVNAYVTTLTTAAQEKGAPIGDRITRAGLLVLAGKVRRLGPEQFEVHSGTHKDKVYQVNGRCECPDFPTAHKGWCKHRLAARMAYWLEKDLAALQHDRIPHAHRYVCTEHTLPEVDCWEQGCMDPVEIPCPICFRPVPNVPAYVEDIIVEEGVPVAEYIAEPMTAISEVLADMEALANRPEETPEAEPRPEPEPALPPIVYETTQYEPAPITCPEEDIVPFLPEAAVSMCLTIKLPDNHTITYTMRGHDDTAVLERLPTVLATLERVLKSDVDHDDHFFQRLAHAFFPRRKATVK